LLNPTPPSPEERRRDEEWVATSPYWLDRQACRWLSLCGVHHLRYDAPTRGEQEEDDAVEFDLRSIFIDEDGSRPQERRVVGASRRTAGFSSRRSKQGPKSVPDFVIAHAPLVHLYSDESFWPADIADFVTHMTPFSKGEALPDSLPLALSNLSELNHHPKTYLTSDDDIESRPGWLHARAGTPDESGHSRAPAILILADKGNGTLDAFWFFFYAYNLGQTVLRVRYGNHVGDWEHCMVRFQRGEPRFMYLSEHAGGQAYAWRALEKRGARPVIYSAVGSHAMYAMPGNHPYVLPFGMLADQTDEGPLWDPSRHRMAFWYDTKKGDVDPAMENRKAPTAWFHFKWPWGDELYPLSDGRQWRLFGQYHYLTGPEGPKFKNLGRKQVCQNEKCTILESLDKKGRWYS
jgi:hypothetical protein